MTDENRTARRSRALILVGVAAVLINGCGSGSGSDRDAERPVQLILEVEGVPVRRTHSLVFTHADQQGLGITQQPIHGVGGTFSILLPINVVEGSPYTYCLEEAVTVRDTATLTARREIPPGTCLTEGTNTIP